MSISSDLVGKFAGAAEQLALWSILAQVVSTAGQPAFTELQGLANEAHPLMPLSPADAAAAVVRNFLTAENGASDAAKGGVDAGRFATLRALAGDAPGPQELVTAVLRGIVAEQGTGPASTSYEQGIAEGRLADKWAPVLRELGKAVITPADAAAAVVRNFLDPGQGEAEAAKSGVGPDLFATLRHLSGDAPAPGQLAEALRRGVIARDGTGPDSTSFQQGIAEGRLADKWTPLIEALARVWPTPVLALDALLKGQMSQQDAAALYEKLGGDPQYFRTEFDTQGNAPTPVEALQLAKRGIIPWTGTGPDAVSYEQAFREGPWRDKWEPSFRALAEYIPPPETVRTLLEQGAIDHAKAAKWWSDYGLPQDTIDAYLAAADFNNTAATRGLTESSVLDMYYAQLISQDDAKKLLDLFGTPASNQDLMLAYVDLRRAVSARNDVVTRIQLLYIARKISTQTAREALGRVKIPADTIDNIIQTWDIAASANVKTLTEAQIVDAWFLQVIDQNAAEAELQAIGYTPYDAWILLSIKSKGPLPNPPPANVAAPAGAVIPGVT